MLEHLEDYDTDFCFLTETWMEADKNDITALVKTKGYKLIHARRKARDKETGGGVGILLKDSIPHKLVSGKTFKSFEHIMLSVRLKNGLSLILISFYRLLFIPISVFLVEFVEFLELLSVLPEQFILSGDINLHLETDDSNVVYLNDVFNNFNLVQHVKESTHVKGHTLDILLTCNDFPIYEPNCHNVQLSDHFLITFKTNIDLYTNDTRTITFRNLDAVDIENFCEIAKDRLSSNHETAFGEKISTYNSTLTKLIDELAPMKSKTIKNKPKSPWFDQEYQDMRKKRRAAEKKYRRTKSENDKKIFVNLRKETTKLASSKKLGFYSEKIDKCSSTNDLFGCINQLTDNTKVSVLPQHDSSVYLANDFNTFFKEKISDIRKAFPSYSSSTENSTFRGEILSTFRPVSEEEVQVIVSKFGIKCSPEDPVPAKILSRCTEFFIPIWTELVNLSLEQGSIDCLKSAVIIPLLKGLDSLLDSDVFKNYRPVSNLQLIGKIIERVVNSQLDEHMDKNNLHSNKQYGYKAYHSTEFLLAKIVNDLLLSCDIKIPTLVMLLDLSAAFDTVDQQKLLDILRNQFGIRGAALRWFKSFLFGRTQKVMINGEYSDPLPLEFGVAQGSILGPKLFNLYIQSFSPQMQATGVEVEGYADDHQLRKQFNLILQFNVLTSGINDIFSVAEGWMLEFFLKINCGKTKIMIVATESIKKLILINGVFVDSVCIRFVDKAKNLGVLIDSSLLFDSHINKVAQGCHQTLRQLARVKRFFTKDQLQILVSSLVLSRVDMCNSLYYNLKTSTICKLKSVLNSAARIVSKVNRFDRIHSLTLLKELHWLNINERVIYKIFLLVFKCREGSKRSCKLFSILP